MKRRLARLVLWLTEDVCERLHHFNILEGGRPGCIANWRWFGLGPNRWLAWALDYRERHHIRDAYDK